MISQIQQKADWSGVSFPAINLDTYTNLGSGGGSMGSNYNHTLGGTLTRLRGAHTVRVGAEFRLYRDNSFAYGNLAPSFTFNANYTKGPYDTSGASSMGQGLASMLLGQPTGGQVSVNASRAEQSWYTAAFIQDDWRIAPRLTLNVGLRWEYNSPLTERYNRSVLGFDYAAAQPFEAAAKAAYAANPVPEIAPSAFSAKGGLTFAGVGGQARQLWSGDFNGIAPRFGLSYQINPPTVVRGGYGFFYVPGGADNSDANQAGFSQTTPIIATNDNGLTFRGTLADPFPDGIMTPTGASTGLQTYLGRAISFFNQDLRSSYTQRWSLNVQRQLRGQIVLEASYIGNRGTKLRASRNINAIPLQYLSTSPLRDQPTINYLATQVPNPFYGNALFTGTSLASAKVGRTHLLRPYPEFGDITYSTNDGYS